MRKMRVGLAAVVFLLGFGLQSAIANTEVCDSITSDTTWTVAGSPYIIVCNVTVDSGVTLTIEPGVTVRFNDSLSLNVSGELIARGTVIDSILFTSNDSTPQPGDWGSIKFVHTSVDAVLDTLENYVSGCIVEYCRVEYGGDIPGSGQDGAIHCDHAAPFISHNTITSNSADCGGGICCGPALKHEAIMSGLANEGIGIRSTEPGPVIINNTICGNSANTGGGVYCCGYELTIANNTITGDSANYGGGIYLYSSHPTITNNTITNNFSEGIRFVEGDAIIMGNTITGNSSSGISYYLAHATISGNTITGNSGSGTFCMSFSDATITGNTITDNAGSGIYLSESGATISHNTITGNSAELGEGGGILVGYTSWGTITSNIICGNSADYGGGISLHQSDGYTTINSNTIRDNTADYGSGIYVGWGSDATMSYNNLANKGEYEIYLDSEFNIPATNNWWGTTNTDTIDARIWDYNDDISLGEVLYDPILTSPAMGEPDSVYSIVLKADSTYTSDLITILWVGAKMYIQLEGEDSDSICVDQTTVTVNSDSTDTLGIHITLTETDSISGIFRGTALIDSVSMEGVSIGATVGETLTITSTVDSTKFTSVLVGEGPNLSNLDIGELEDIDHLVTHYPIITWSYSDTLGLPQDAFQIQGGTDDDWSIAEMWDTGEVSSADTFVTYAGDSLLDGETYYLRARVKNSGGLWSGWANLSFRMNSRPTMAIALSPYDGQILGDSMVTLIVSNSTDAEEDTLTYDFVVYSDTLTDSIVTSVTGVSEGTDSTSWQIDVHLDEEWPYWWSARAHDSFDYGEWTPVRSFIVNTEYDPPSIKSITDIPNDQGRQVTVSWYASEYDAPGDTITITEYCLWRRIDSLSIGLNGNEAKEDDIPSLKSFPPGDWHYVLTVPACGQEVYNCVAPTLCDLTSDDTCWSVFFISAMTPEPLIFFASEIDSGYSVDNLVPSTPQGLTAASGDTSINLTWRAIPDLDFRYYAVYRRTDQDSTLSILGTTIDTSYCDSEVLSDSTYYYRVSAFDFAGNESNYSDSVIAYVPVNVSYEGQNSVLPDKFSLPQNYPNPFNPTTVISYQLSGVSPHHTTLRVHNILGQEVRILVDKEQLPGYYSVVWDGKDSLGKELASGIYFYRLQAGDFVQTRKMVLIR